MLRCYHTDLYLLPKNMPEHIRSLVVLTILASLFFWAVADVSEKILGQQLFRRWRFAWFVVTFTAFMSHQVWVFFLIYGCFVYLQYRKIEDPVAIYLVLLLALPIYSAHMPGLGVVNYLATLTPPRILGLALLLPVALGLLKRSDISKPGSLATDKLLIGYIFLSFILETRGATLTDATRSLLYSVTDIFLPYFVASRALQRPSHFRTTCFALVLSGGLLSVVGLFEMLKSWLLYSALPSALDANPIMGDYLKRSGLLRASATTGQAIVLGFCIMVSIGFFLYIQKLLSLPNDRRKIWAALACGLIAPLSRGPWLGATLCLITFIASGKRAMASLLKLGLVGVVFLAATPWLPGGEKIINLIPFIGSTERENIDYRDRLIDNALIVIDRNFWFGSVNYLETPEMQSMIQGQGIIDIVNSYIGVALNYGVVGLALYLGFFLVILFRLFRIVRRSYDRDVEEIVLGRSLLATWLGIMFTIFTVSSISFIPYIYWTVGGIAVAYIQMMNNLKITADA